MKRSQIRHPKPPVARIVRMNQGSMERIRPDPDSPPTRIRNTTGVSRIDDESSSLESQLWPPSLVCGDPAPFPVLRILVIVTILLGISWRFSKESTAKSKGSETGWSVRAIPLLLILILHWLTSSEISKIMSEISGQDNDQSSRNDYFAFPYKRETFRSCALAMLIAFLVVMAQFQSNIRNLWFLNRLFPFI